MAGPTEHRSLHELKQLRRQEKRVRRLTKRELHRNRMMYVVTWGLLFVFGIMSVGLIIMFRPASSFKTGSASAPADQRQQLQDTLSSLQKNAEASPADENWHFEEAGVYLKLGQVNPAVAQLKATLKLNPSHLQALHMLAQLYLMRNRPREAAAALERGMKAEQKFIARHNRERKAGEPSFEPDATTRAMLMQAYLALGPGHDAQARQAARQALALQPDDFVNYLRTFTLQMAIMRKGSIATRALQIALQEAERQHYPKAVADIKELRRMVVGLSKQSALKPERTAVPPAASAGPPTPVPSVKGPSPAASSSGEASPGAALPSTPAAASSATPTSK